MFTGLVETTGRVVALDALPGSAGIRLVVQAPRLARESAVGDSIAINGCCLTVTRQDGETVAFDAVPETLALHRSCHWNGDPCYGAGAHTSRHGAGGGRSA